MVRFSLECKLCEVTLYGFIYPSLVNRSDITVLLLQHSLGCRVEVGNLDWAGPDFIPWNIKMNVHAHLPYC